ncbi:MAG: Rho termination factor N-terminal domain-containing protein, partial [Actinomycetes bacterium]
MTSEVQLGRSVLESKERTELQAIAEQLSVKTTSRMKKADLISEILTAAGVGEPAAPSEAPARPAGRRPAAAKVEKADDGGSSAERSDSAADEGTTSETGDDEGTEAPRANNDRRRGDQNRGQQRDGQQ